MSETDETWFRFTDIGVTDPKPDPNKNSFVFLAEVPTFMREPGSYADRPAVPRIEIWPWMTELLQRARALRQRTREVIEVAKHGLPEREEW